MEKNQIPVYFNSFDLHYIPLPENYSILPITALGPQPAAYAQGTFEMLYVTIAIPVSGQHTLIQPEGIGLTMSDLPKTYMFRCTFAMGSDQANVQARLALIGFSVCMPRGVAKDDLVQLSIYVIPDPKKPDDNVGKVVMDANILPTWP
ncbi:hypothetical protein FAM09_13900 [Niastella caeni]|uniref:Uncharacterized protein n=1 Tax=Niastella caeni TaxID=2569763 RepID=A0A4S8HVG2_9BACT|nr:hypothetical protein [Niastella caeni]THU39590.1 hypothetical protein FAM09_13900 [Niastella caeni]